MASKVRTFGTGNVIYVRWQVLFQVRCGCFLQGSTQAVSPLHFWVLFDITLGFQLTQPAKSPKSCTLYDITFRCISHINIYIMLYIYILYIYILYIYIYISNIFSAWSEPPHVCLTPGVLLFSVSSPSGDVLRRGSQQDHVAGGQTKS